MRTSLLVLVSFCVLAAPVSADVLTSRRAPGKNADKVSDRVAALGVKGGEARTEVVAMTDADRAYFAWSPDRVQVVGAQQDMFSGQVTPLTSELIIGSVGAVLGVGLVFFMVRNNE